MITRPCLFSGLYLDKKGFRSARSGKKVTWVDKFGNNHDLDYVLEKDGSETKIGTQLILSKTIMKVMSQIQFLGMKSKFVTIMGIK